MNVERLMRIKENIITINDDRCCCLLGDNYLYGTCNSKRRFYVFDANDLTTKKITVCNERIRLLMSEKKILYPKYYTAEYIYNLVVKSILGDNKIYNKDCNYIGKFSNKEHGAVVYFTACARPSILSEMTLVEAMKKIFDNSWSIKSSNDWLLYSDFAIAVTGALYSHLTYLMQYKKYKHQHNAAERILRKIDRHQSAWSTDDEFLELILLIFNLNISKRESTSK